MDLKTICKEVAGPASVGALIGYAGFGISPVGGAALALTSQLVNKIFEKYQSSFFSYHTHESIKGLFLWTPRLGSLGASAFYVLQYFKSAMSTFQGFAVGEVSRYVGRPLGTMFYENVLA